MSEWANQTKRQIRHLLFWAVVGMLVLAMTGLHEKAVSGHALQKFVGGSWIFAKEGVYPNGVGGFAVFEEALTD
jgi:hypothetical protein